MPRRKKAVKQRRIRRSPYERSLDFATARLTKAIAERDDAAQKLAELDKEIPYLQSVIRALTPPSDKPSMKRNDLRGNTYAPPMGLSLSIVHPSADIPDDVKKYIKPISANVDELPAEDDKFLAVNLPAGTDLLP